VPVLVLEYLVAADLMPTVATITSSTTGDHLALPCRTAPILGVASTIGQVRIHCIETEKETWRLTNHLTVSPTTKAECLLPHNHTMTAAVATIGVHQSNITSLHALRIPKLTPTAIAAPTSPNIETMGAVRLHLEHAFLLEAALGLPPEAIEILTFHLTQALILMPVFRPQRTEGEMIALPLRTGMEEGMAQTLSMEIVIPCGTTI